MVLTSNFFGFSNLQQPYMFDDRIIFLGMGFVVDFFRKVRGVPIWALVTLSVCLVVGGVAAYIFGTFNVAVNVGEPLSVVASPNLLELYPNMTQAFNITVNDAATVNYLVALTFTLNDTVYQNSYVTFSNTTYTVLPGLNNLTASINVASDAPPAQLELTLTLSRVSATEPTYDYSFSWSKNAQVLVNGTLNMKLQFAFTNDSLLITAEINDTTFYPSIDLGIIFDEEFDGFHLGDQGYALFADNTTFSGYETQLGYGWFLTGAVKNLPRPSPYHYCTFNNETGYTFYVHFPLTVVPVKTQQGQVLRAHVDFGGDVEVEFAFENYRP